MKLLSYLGCSFSVCLSFGQTFSDAQTHFDRFEYAETIRVLEKIDKKHSFDLDQLKQLGYSYYAVGDFNKALPIIDSILQYKPIEPYFYYMQGEARMAVGKNDQAIESFHAFTRLEKNADVALRISSSQEMKDWSVLEIRKVEEAHFNHHKSTTLGTSFSNGHFIFREIGVDKSGKLNYEPSEVNKTELLLMRPFFLDSELTPIQVEGIENYWSIHDICIEPGSAHALITISKPIANKESDRLHRLYTGTYNPELKTLQVLEPWKVLDGKKGVSSGYATFQENGSTVVFTMTNAPNTGSNLFHSQKNADGTWQEPIALSGINTTMNELYPRFINHSTLSFSSDGRLGYGGLDIYSVTLENGIIQPESLTHLPSPINSHRDDFNVYYEGDSIIHVTTNRYASTTDDNVLHLYLPIPVKEEEVIVLPENPDIDLLARWKFNYLYFNFDMYKIKDDEQLNFAELNEFLKRNSEFKLALTGKTDERGDANYNYQLGLKRAQSVKDELISFGFNENQIIIGSKGKSEPVIDCTQGCTEEEHAKNRVVIIELLASEE